MFPPDYCVPVGDDLLALIVLAAARDGARPAGECVGARGAEGVAAAAQDFGLDRVSVAFGTLESETRRLGAKHDLLQHLWFTLTLP